MGWTAVTMKALFWIAILLDFLLLDTLVFEAEGRKSRSGTFYPTNFVTYFFTTFYVNQATGKYWEIFVHSWQSIAGDRLPRVDKNLCYFHFDKLLFLIRHHFNCFFYQKLEYTLRNPDIQRTCSFVDDCIHTCYSPTYTSQHEWFNVRCGYFVGTSLWASSQPDQFTPW